MRSYAKAPIDVPSVRGKPVIIEIPSSNGKSTYKLDLSQGRCSCKAWIFGYNKNGRTGRTVCKHLRMFGYTDLDQ